MLASMQAGIGRLWAGSSRDSRQAGRITELFQLSAGSDFNGRPVGIICEVASAIGENTAWNV